jgi:hypothetical protein
MSTQARILEIFSTVREDKNAPFDTSDLLQFLVRPNGKRIDDSFKGKRYKTRFIHALQSEFAICFPNDFYDKRWDLDALVPYVEKRAANTKANLETAQKRYARSKKTDIGFILIANLLLLSPLSVMWQPYTWLYALVPLSFNLLMLRFKLGDIAYHKALVARIEASGTSL